MHARSAANPLGETPGWGMSVAPRPAYIAIHEKRAVQGNEAGSPGRFAARRGYRHVETRKEDK